jgi:hypothetical protein
MRKWSHYLVGVVAVTGLHALAACAGAETCTLELKKFDLSANPDPGGLGYTSLPANFAFRYSLPQTFVHYADDSVRFVTPPIGVSVNPSGARKPEFSEVIKRELASYNSGSPFRGVAELGSQYYGFVLDTDPAEKAPTEETGGEGSAAPSSPVGPTTGLATYRRLHFDLNHNGDLTDDEVIESLPARTAGGMSSTSNAVFPAIDIKLDLGGTKADYTFRISVSSRRSGSVAYATASLSSAAYREGEILLDGTKRRVVLVDMNSNGRFDDPPAVNERYQGSNGAIYSLVGDMLYINPEAVRRVSHDARSGNDQFYAGGLIGYLDRFFEVKVSPAGDTLTIEPLSEPVGFVTNPNKGFRAFVYGDRGMLEIAADSESGKAPLPPGEWKLLSYTIDQTGLDEQSTVLDVLYRALPVPPNRNIVSARGTRNGKAVTVVAGETVEMAFGAPYRLNVGSQAIPAKNSISLNMTLVGSAGEICSGLVVNGGQPSQPEFTISTPDGAEVVTGKFKYG